METVQYDYKQILQRIVAEIKSSRIQVARKITSATMELYWNIGKELSFLHYVSLAFLRFCSFDGKPAVVNVFLFYV